MYGHPDSGGYWERHCRDIVVNKCKEKNGNGFTEIPTWPDVYFHSARNLLLVGYVDDFKMSGPPEAVSWGDGSAYSVV